MSEVQKANIFNENTISWDGEVLMARLYITKYPGVEFVEDGRPDYFILREQLEKLLIDVYGSAGKTIFKSYISTRCVEVRTIEEHKVMFLFTMLIEDDITDRNYRFSSKDLEVVHELNDIVYLQERLDSIAPEDYNSRGLAPIVRDEELKHVSVKCFYYPLENTELGEKFCTEFSALKFDRESQKPATDNAIYTIASNSQGLLLNKHYLDTKKYRSEIIDSNYNDSFSDAYPRLVSFLKSDDNGLVLLTGEPGTGKSSLLMHLTSLCKDLNTKFVFIPAVFASILSDPTFLPFALNNLNNSVIVLEDAEDVLKDRSAGGGSAVSNILNVTDGILGKLMKVKLIATVNKAHVIDFAIMRKGRLKLQYEFEKLSADKANKLFKKLGKERTTDVPMTLADIYNDLSPEVSSTTPTPKRKIGF